MSIIIEVTSTEVKTRSGTSQKTGKPYSINEQEAYVHKMGQPYPEKISIVLQDGNGAYNPGNYDLHPSSYFVDRFGQLSVRPVLCPRPAENRQPEGVKVSK